VANALREPDQMDRGLPYNACEVPSSSITESTVFHWPTSNPTSAFMHHFRSLENGTFAEFCLLILCVAPPSEYRILVGIVS
jgi:hypothetical protein